MSGYKRSPPVNIKQLIRYVIAASVGAILAFLFLSGGTGTSSSSKSLFTTTVTRTMRTMNINEDLHLNLDGFTWGKRNFFGNAYMKRRSNLDYYKSIIKLSQHYAPDATSVIDVGAPWPFITAFDWIPEKTMLNDRYPDGISAPGLTLIETDFYQFEPTEKYDLVICNQVMEHVDDPQRFAQKLLSIGKTVIASVPYMWPSAHSFGHKHHMIDVPAFVEWFNRTDYSEVGIINEVNRVCGKSCRRLYVVYRPPVADEDKIYEPSHTQWNDKNDGKNHENGEVAMEEE